MRPPGARRPGPGGPGRVTYWLVPVLSGRALWRPRLALAQAWLWFGGMVIFSNSLHRLGLMSMPRRTSIGAAPYVQPEWKPLLPLVGIGGAILFASALPYFAIIGMTAFASKREAVERPAFAEALSGPADAPAFLDRLAPWVGAALVLILLAYGPTIWHLSVSTPFSSPGFRVW